MRVVALIPAYNEEHYITSTLEAVGGIPQIHQIIVIDDGSTDSTRACVRDYQQRGLLPVELVTLPRNEGKGGALNAGLERGKGEVYLLLDADLGASAKWAGALLGPVLRGEADMTVARFSGAQSSGQGKMGFGVVRRLACLGILLLTGKRVTSPLSGQRALRADVVQCLGGFAQGFGVEVTLTVGALHHGFKVLEVPLPLKHRAYGRGLQGWRHRGRQLVHVLRALGECWKRGWHR